MNMLNVKNKYKSIQTITFNDTFPDFSLIVGINGSGKSHLFEGLQTGNFLLNSIRHDEITLKTLVDVLPEGLHNLKGDSFKQLISSVHNIISQDTFAQQYHSLTTPGQNMEQHKATTEQLRRTLVNQLRPQFTQRITRDENRAARYLEDRVTHDLFSSNTNLAEAIENLSSSFDVFTGNITDTIISYCSACLKHRNALFEKHLTTESDTISLKTIDSDFTNRYGTPPWEIFNIVMEANKSPIRMKRPDYIMAVQTPEVFSPELYHLTTTERVTFQDLSSGEKVLTTFAMAAYRTQYSNSKLSSPFFKLLLLDEVDAPLHPSMISKLIEIIDQVIIKKLGVKVIMSTHSPTTVALFKESSIFQIERSCKDISIKRVSQKDATAALLEGVPNVTVSQDTSRNVFVESFIDKDLYEKSYFMWPDRRNHRILNFIAIQKDKSNNGGGCETLKTVVTSINRNQKSTVCGIIDWDEKNQTQKELNLFSVFDSYCYSIENIILNPLAVGTLILHMYRSEESEWIDTNRFNDLTSSEMSNPKAELAQKISDAVVARFIERNQNSSVDRQHQTTFEVLFHNFTLIVPRFCLTTKGHSWEKDLQNSFHCLKGYKREGDLKKEITSTIMPFYTWLFPVKLGDLFRSIAESSAS